MRRFGAAVVGTSGTLLVLLGILGPVALPLGHVHVWWWWALQELLLLIVFAVSAQLVQRGRRPKAARQPVTKPQGLTYLSLLLLVLTGIGYLAVYVLSLPAVSAAHSIARHEGRVVGHIDNSGAGKYSTAVAVYTVDGKPHIEQLAQTDTLHFRGSFGDRETALAYNTEDPSTVMTLATYRSALHGTDFLLYGLGWIPTMLAALLYGWLYRRQLDRGQPSPVDATTQD